MKICPICKVKYSDDAEFCAKCKTVLIEMREEDDAPFNRKGLLTAILSTAAFMLVIAGLVFLLSRITG